MRLPPFDENETVNPLNVKARPGQGSGKDGHPLVADLIWLRENESRLVEELADEKDRTKTQLQTALAE